ncbi:M20/M25/M40 family metallo-hydrolase [Streptomyces tubbatahanensis]|uniref:M20/M25/M40 family metallo-hydrolase n=1 Tax=Streptomyces tubbatahanensis TaxID=2923272 RepID=A0ABY3XMV9_9ACTN|nr:M20/M25/M40 family metallo-hydrolase [Streptomyces tubbatahanensis]UNS95735.1 M20/M25/M40 family metallo-hydrolase [Streptomyces tubbatahanensis]
MPGTREHDGTPPEARLSAADRELLLRLMELPTAGPLETGPGATPQLWSAQAAYAEAAARLGCTVVHHAAPQPETLLAPGVPRTVTEAAAERQDFLACQPSTVLRLGPELPHEATVMFNVHLDTVAGGGPAHFDGRRFHGRGAIDAKGPAVGLLAGLRAALAACPELGTRAGVLIQLVSGEEGGAMGVFGTRPLVEAGWTGRLNVFCEPTGLRVLDRSTAAMTAALRVRGRDGIDDTPGGGHNATVLLGHLAQHLARELPQPADGQVCVGGLHTGTMHNKVYGSGDLLINLSYGSPATAWMLERALKDAVRSGVAEFRERFARHPSFALTAADADRLVRLDWLKRGLPALGPGPGGESGAGGDPWCAELLLERAGLEPWPAGAPAFTCDAIWLADVPGTSTVVLGPGDLDANGAHAEEEFADLADLDAYAGHVARVLLHFARNSPPTTPRTLRPPLPEAAS